MSGVCRVCELLDNDKTIKEVFYCEMCNASMCKECEGNLLRRGRAAIKETYEKMVNKQTTYR